MTKEVSTEKNEINYVPDVDVLYYTYGNFKTVKKIIESRKFYPIWVSGLSGNGKTQMIEQACARADMPNYTNTKTSTALEKSKAYSGKGREFIRVNFTMETDENDLIGSMRLDYKENADGTKEEIGTTFHEGPVTEALRRGAILLLDEVDIGHTNRIMCLQSVMEGKGVLIKATGEYVKAAPGFQIFATSNTKGKASEDGRFIGTNIMNAAFLDRFAGTIVQDYPTIKIESELLKQYFIQFHWSHLKEEDISKEEINAALEFISQLCVWADQIRKTFVKGGVSEIITTRTLINVIQGYSILGKQKEAISMACERFDSATKDSFVSMYEKLAPNNPQNNKPAERVTPDTTSDYHTFTA